jgi:hypothetical protein
MRLIRTAPAALFFPGGPRKTGKVFFPGNIKLFSDFSETTYFQGRVLPLPEDHPWKEKVAD